MSSEFTKLLTWRCPAGTAWVAVCVLLIVFYIEIFEKIKQKKTI